MIAAIALFFAFSTPIENTAVEKDNYARLLPIDLFEKIENRSVVMTPVEVKQETKKSVTTAKISHGATSSEKETGKRATKPLVVKEVKVVKPVAEKQMEDNYHIIVAGGITLKDAEIMAEQLKAKGFHRAKVLNSDGKVRVSIMSYATREEAMKQLLKIRENEAYKTAWMLAK
jgi:cell division septation protein DedD